jgi:glycosyltransferase involved in cell wall biosynthesis
VDPEIPVPPKHYGGIERVVYLLVCGLAEQGHAVTLFANSNSLVSCDLVPYPGQASRSWGDTCRNTMRVAALVAQRRFDLVHSFGRLLYLLPLLPGSLPKLMSYQRHVSRLSVTWGHRLSGGSLQFTACSRQMIQAVEHLAAWHVIYNGVGADQYEFRSDVASDAPLVFLGRLEQIKGPHLAIEAARRAGRRLVIAGNVPEERHHRKYFETEILPHVDADRVRFMGPVDDRQKNALLGEAAALLMPILWDEPFGIVMAEALACGTPVVGFRRGSVPEVVEDGVNGFGCNDVAGMSRAIEQLQEIDRAACRRSMEQRFSSTVMVREYLRVYSSLMGV